MDERILNRFGFYSELLIFSLGVVVSIWDVFGLDGTTGFGLGQDKIISLTLLLISSIGVFFVLNKQTNKKQLEEIISKNFRELTTLISPLSNDNIKFFESRKDFFRFIIPHFEHINKRIDVTQLGPRHVLQYMDSGTSYYQAQVNAVKAGITLRRFVIVENADVLDFIEKSLEELKGENYFVRSFPKSNVAFPLFNIMILDNLEVAVGISGGSMDEEYGTLWIRHPYVVKTFSEYFKKLWQSATKLNELEIYYDLIKEIRKSLLDPESSQ